MSLVYEGKIEVSTVQRQVTLNPVFQTVKSPKYSRFRVEWRKEYFQMSGLKKKEF
jgi:hypothetical protein